MYSSLNDPYRDIVLRLLADGKYHSTVEVANLLGIRVPIAYNMLTIMHTYELVEKDKGMDNSRMRPDKSLRSRVNIYKLTKKGFDSLNGKVIQGEAV